MAQSASGGTGPTASAPRRRGGGGGETPCGPEAPERSASGGHADDAGEGLLLLATPRLGREHREVGVGPPQEGVVVPLHLRGAVAEGERVDAFGVRRIAHVEQRHLGAEPHALVGRVLPDAEQQPVAERVEVCRVPGDLQLADHARVGRIGQIEGVERVGLLEGDHVADVTEEPDGVDLLAFAHPSHLAELGEPVAVARERRDVALRLGCAARPRLTLGGRDPEHALVLAEGELVQERAVDGAGRQVGRRAVTRDRELVEVGDDLAAAGHGPFPLLGHRVHLGPAGGGHGEDVLRGVHLGRVTDDGDGREVVERPADLGGEDRHRPEARVLRRVRDRRAVVDGLAGPAAGTVRLVDGGDPVVERRAAHGLSVLRRSPCLRRHVVGIGHLRPRRAALHDDPRGAVDHPGAHQPAVDEPLGGDGGRRGVGEIDLGEQRRRSPDPDGDTCCLRCGCLRCGRLRCCRLLRGCIEVAGRHVAGGEHEGTVAVDEELVAPPVERDRADHGGVGRRGVDHPEDAADHRDDVAPVVLHHVGLVDADLRDVRARRRPVRSRAVALGPGDGVRRRGRHGGRGRRFGRDGHVTGRGPDPVPVRELEPVGSDALHGLVGDPTEQLAAVVLGGERGGAGEHVAGCGVAGGVAGGGGGGGGGGGDRNVRRRGAGGGVGTLPAPGERGARGDQRRRRDPSGPTGSGRGGEDDVVSAGGHAAVTSPGAAPVPVGSTFPSVQPMGLHGHRG